MTLGMRMTMSMMILIMTIPEDDHIEENEVEKIMSFDLRFELHRLLGKNNFTLMRYTRSQER